MSHEGVVFVERIAMVLLLILVGAVVRTFAGPSKRRVDTMNAGGPRTGHLDRVRYS